MYSERSGNLKNSAIRDILKITARDTERYHLTVRAPLPCLILLNQGTIYT